ncbi:hypothetical protein C8N35_102118 [Breoghania corrubedonensis]|uniref:Uncharacterized protein n=1 Tax=Breoghania corrubedonensis TaxID=665038 RepID=A0A2T5VCC3_9HYPH|nr:hypothetical protein [Breoghania corrubedonensis]PTW61409.1 hypothetical protein C8N35_102118 [Breoghania corrubedonensis]
MTHGILITDHAVMRYVERVIGIDLDAVRAKIANEIARTQARADLSQLPDRYAIRTADATYVIRRNVMTTVLRRGGTTFFPIEGGGS